MTKSMTVMRCVRRGLVCGCAVAAFALAGSAATAAPAAKSSPKPANTSCQAPQRSALAQQSGGAARAGPFANAHCRCDITCTGTGIASFNMQNSPFPGYSQLGNVDKNRCRNDCEQWVNNNMDAWAKDRGVCGQLSCRGTAKVGTASPLTTVTITKTRECCPPAGNGEACAPGGGADVLAQFQLVQTPNLAAPYKLQYLPALGSSYDNGFKAYVNWVRWNRPNLHTMWVDYHLIDVTNPNAPVNVDWGVTKYMPGTPATTIPGGFFLSSLQTNHTYRVERGMAFKNAAGGDIPFYGDPSCGKRGFTVSLQTTTFMAAPRPGVATASAMVKVDGQPDRAMPVVVLTDAQSAERERFEQDAPKTPRPAQAGP